MSDSKPFFNYFPPMGIYKTLYAFLDSFGSYMGSPGTHPWSQGYPVTSQLPGGPKMPTNHEFPPEDLMYPKAWGLPALREAIAGYYKTYYGSDISSENVMVFAGGRPALIALLLFLDPEVNILIAETEYTPYYDMLERLGRKYSLIQSNIANNFSPTLTEYTKGSIEQRSLIMMSNPCNPTGITTHGESLSQFVEAAQSDNKAALFDEAYELFHDAPVSAMQYIRNIDESNAIVVGAATKGLQAPGIRIGWVVASKATIEILGNFSSFGMGGVSHLSQRVATKMLEEEHVSLSRKAVPTYYKNQRDRYGEAFEKIGLKNYSGDGGFYHWCQLPSGLSAEEFNQRLFKEGAAVLKGTDCDMARRGEISPLRNFFRFSFGPLLPDSFESDIDILKRTLQS
ncbi:MAG: pyridoxal phosphate-dependent aminotransferase [Chloroflexota bacterium]